MVVRRKKKVHVLFKPQRNPPVVENENVTGGKKEGKVVSNRQDTPRYVPLLDCYTASFKVSVLLTIISQNS